MAVTYTLAQLDEMISMARRLGLDDEDRRWSAERERVAAAGDPAAPRGAVAPDEPSPLQLARLLDAVLGTEGPSPLASLGEEPVENPPVLGWPWVSADGREDPDAKRAVLDCGCYQRVDDQVVLCPAHLAALNGACCFAPADWGGWDGIDGPVLLCHTHRMPASHEAYTDLSDPAATCGWIDDDGAAIPRGFVRDDNTAQEGSDS